MKSNSFSPINNKIALYALLYIVLLVLVPHTGHPYDNWCWQHWTAFIFNQGLENAYLSGSDYPPLYYYIISLFASLKGSEEAIRNHIYELKYITLLFEFCSVMLLFKFIKEDLRPVFFIFVMLNPGFLYNSVFWGQVDGILSFLIMSSVLLLINRKNTLGLLLFILCINFKLQSIIYFPLISFILLYNIADFKGFKYAFVVLLSIISLQFFIILPFISTESATNLTNVIFDSVDRYPKVSMNAYNWWFWFFDGDLTLIYDTGLCLNITYKTWGLLIFFITSIAALLPLFVIGISNIFNKSLYAIQNIDVVFASAALVTILFFFFNTQMHERYSHYALIFLAGYFAVKNNYFPFLLACFAYFLNMESVLHALNFPNYGILVFNPAFIAILYFVLIIVLYYLIYKNSNFLDNIKYISHSLTTKFFKTNTTNNI